MQTKLIQFSTWQSFINILMNNNRNRRFHFRHTSYEVFRSHLCSIIIHFLKLNTRDSIVYSTQHAYYIVSSQAIPLELNGSSVPVSVPQPNVMNKIPEFYVRPNTVNARFHEHFTGNFGSQNRTHFVF